MTCKSRIFTSVLLSAVALLLACTVVSAASYTLGDADQDQDVSIIDATAVLRSVADIKKISDGTAFYAADVDKSGSIEAIDATYIQRWLANINTTHPIGTQFETPTEAPTEAPTTAPTEWPTDSEGWGQEIYRP